MNGITMLGELAALGAALCWALSAALYKVALSEAKAISANISRCISTTIFLVLGLFVTGRVADLMNLRAHMLFLAALSGVIGLCLGDTMYMLSLKLIGVSRAVPVASTYPLFTIFLEAIFLGAKTTPFLLGSATLTLAGIWLIGRGNTRSRYRIRGSLFKGVLFALFTAVVWSVSIILMDNAQRLSELPPADAALIVNAIRVFATTAAFLALSPLIDRQFHFVKLKRETWITLALGGIVALGLGWFLLTLSLSHIHASRAVPISSISPLFSTFFGILFLKEKGTLRVLIGSVMVVLGTAGVFVI